MRNLYALRAWHRARRLHLAEEPMCRMCAERGVETVAAHVDHIVPIAQGGDCWDGGNLQSLCVPCHSRKTLADEGKSPGPPRLGCDRTGTPMDPQHHWNRSR